MSVPLDERQVVHSAKGSMPALHPSRIEKTNFVTYTEPPIDTTDQAQYGEWMERLQFIAEDLHWLLQQPHDKFWCQIVFDEKLQALIDSYLRYAPRSYDVVYMVDLPDTCKDKHKEVHRLIFMTILRMATHKESKEQFISPKIFGDILYENFLFDIPKILDMCVLYGKGNTPLLSKIVSNIFTQQPKYEDDLRATIPTILHVFDTVVAKCRLDVDSSLSEPKKLGKTKSEETLLTVSIGEFQDIVFYIADIGSTLSSFMEIYPPSCDIFHEFNFEQRLASFYEQVIPELLHTIKLRSFDDISHLHLMKQKLHQGKTSLKMIFNLIISHTCIEPLLDKAGKDSEPYVEDFLQTMTSVLGERRFLADYESNYCFQDIMDIFNQAECSVDDEQLQYIRNAVNSAFATFGKRKKPSGATKTGGRTSPDGSPGPPDEQGAVGGAYSGGASTSYEESGVGEESESEASYYPNEAYQTENYDRLGAEALSVSPVEIESMISAVKDLLPDLGEGFIELALEELNYSVERVINCILEDKLPPSLEELDRSLIREIPVPKSELLVESRRNIYDGDEFDVFRRDDIDMSRIHKGKQEEKVSMTDKSFIKEFKATYDAYGSADVESMYDQQIYDDEYDDTYDVNNVGADDADSADELTSRRQFTTPRVFLGRETGKEESGSSESDTEYNPANSSDGRRRDQFVADPAKLREAAAQRHADKSARRGRGGGSGPTRKYDVEGQAKGHGQSADVNKNRTYKDKHKSSRANHNRRDMSDRKRRV